MKNIQIEYASTAVRSFDDLVEFLANDLGEEKALERISKMTQKAEKLIEACPTRPPCSEATLLGVYQYSELVVDGYRVIFEFEKHTHSVNIALLLRDRQSIRAQLERYCLLWDR